MPFGQYESEKPVAIPTFLQFCKTASKQIEGKTKFGIDVVWLPGKFDNVTLQTHAFRFICSSSHPLYGEVIQYFGIIKPGNPSERIEIIIDSISEKKITVMESPRKKGEWSKLGENAYRFKEN